METCKVAKTYKDRLFRLVFRKKNDLLDLYNAVNQSDYTDPEQLEITTIENVVYIGMKNDISFLIDDILNLYEHQSTYNPNMPIRGLLYFAELYRKYVDSRKLNLLGSKLIPLPLPQYIVFYNGRKEEPDYLKLKLSDAFRAGKEDSEIIPCLELTVTMLNINLGHNRELMERCQKLKEYAQFIACVRERLEKGESLEHAVNEAVERCIKDGILAEILSSNRAEVCDVVLTEYDEQSHIASERADSWAEGREAGKIEGLATGKAVGRAAGRAEAILDILSDKGAVSEMLRARLLEEHNLELLHQWIKLAVQVASVEAFEQGIEGMS